MDHISQLKKIRTEAIARLRNSPDFLLAGKLGSLIVELGETVDDTVDFDEMKESGDTSAIEKPAVEAKLPFRSIFPEPEELATAPDANDEEIDDLVAEIQGDAAELDAIMAEDSDNPDVVVAGSVLKQETSDSHYGNGVSH